MIAIGILISILGYAVVYSGVEEIKTGTSVPVLDTLKPGFTPPPPQPVDTSVVGTIKREVTTPGGWWNALTNYVNPLGNLLGRRLPGQKAPGQ